MTAPTTGRDDATVRGAIVLVVAIVIGLALLARSGGGGDDDADATTTTTAAATASTEAGSGGTSDDTTVPVGSDSTSSSVPSDTLAPADVVVAVLNATTTTGWARENGTILSGAGYQTEEGNVAVGAETATSVIYSTPEAQANAEAVKGLLQLSNATISPKTSESIGRNGEDANAQIVVVLGSDSLAGGGGGTSGSSTTGSSTTTTSG